MARVACSGFPLPVSRYFQEMRAVEISETELAMPGAGTVRRWLREAPKGFAFSVLAPKQIAESGFASTKENAAALASILELAKTLGALAVVMVAPPEFAASRPHRAALRAFAESAPKRGRRPALVVDLPAWSIEEASAAVKGVGLEVAYNPLAGPTPTVLDIAYARLPGPAGHRSRYEETALDRIAAHSRAIKAKDSFCVFCNIDMFANATYVMHALGQS